MEDSREEIYRSFRVLLNKSRVFFHSRRDI